MKSNIKSYVSGFVTAVSLLGAGSLVYANARTESISVTYNNIRLVVNGSQVIPRDGQGNVVEPFIFNGTTFLPVRAVADALGQEVHWDGGTQTVYLGQRVSQVAVPVPLFNRSFLEVGNSNGFSATGTATQNHIVVGTNLGGQNLGNGRHVFTNHVVYPLNMAATRFQAVLNPPLASSRGQGAGSPELVYRVFGDNVLLYESPILIPATAPISLDLDVTNKMQLRIEAEWTSSNSGGPGRNGVNDSRGIENAVLVTTDQ